MSNQEIVIIRNYKKEDEAFVYSTFLLGVYHGESWFSKIQKSIFLHNYRLFLNKLIAFENTQIKIACLKDDEDTLVGYSIMTKSEDTLHWVFVKNAWRKIGVAKTLVPNTIKNVTHLSSQGEKIMETHPGMVFNPFLT
jgi:hypothetical protein